MKVNREKVEDSQAFLTIEMEPAEVDESLEGAYRRLVKKADIPGFRKGKAPRAILERYLSKESLFEDALNHLVPNAYQQAIKEQKLEAIAQPQIEIVKTDPIIFKAVVPLRPTVKLGDYHHIQVTPELTKVTEDDVSTVLDRLRHQHAIWEPVERPTSFNDSVTFDIESKVEDKPFINQKAAQYQVIQNHSFPIPGFAEQLVGMAKGEEKKFQLQFPSDYTKSELTGKEASFKVGIIEIKQEKLPELDDEFAKQVDSDMKTLDSLRERISTDLKLRAEEKARIDFEEKIIGMVADTAQVEFPPILAEREIDRLLDQRVKRWQMGGNVEEYLKNINKTEEQIREELRPVARKTTIWSLVLGELANEEKIKVKASEINTEIKNMLKNTAEDKKDELNKLLNTPHFGESIKQTLITRKTIKRLVEIAEGSNMSGETQQKEEEK